MANLIRARRTIKEAWGDIRQMCIRREHRPEVRFGLLQRPLGICGTFHVREPVDVRKHRLQREMTERPHMSYYDARKAVA